MKNPFLFLFLERHVEISSSGSGSSVLWRCLSHTWTSWTLLLNIRFVAAGYPHNLPRIFIYMCCTYSIHSCCFILLLSCLFFSLCVQSFLCFTINVFHSRFMFSFSVSDLYATVVWQFLLTCTHKHTHAVIGGHLKSLPHPFVAIFSSCTVTEHG